MFILCAMVARRCYAFSSNDDAQVQLYPIEASLVKRCNYHGQGTEPGGTSVEKLAGVQRKAGDGVRAYATVIQREGEEGVWSGPGCSDGMRADAAAKSI